MQLLESCLRALNVDIRFAAVAGDHCALNRRRTSLDPAAQVRDQSRAAGELNDREKSADVGAHRRHSRGAKVLIHVSTSNPLSQYNVYRAEVLGQTMTLQFRRERRREYSTGDPDRVLSNAEFVAQSSLDLEHAFGRRRWRDRVHRDGLVPRAEPQRASHALIEARGIPRQVEMYDDRRLLKIETFAEQIGGDEQVNAFCRTNRSNSAARRNELRDDLFARRSPTGDPRAVRR